MAMQLVLMLYNNDDELVIQIILWCDEVELDEMIILDIQDDDDEVEV